MSSRYKYKKKCNHCNAVNPPDSKSCGRCKNVFTSSHRRTSTERNKADKFETSEVNFDQQDIDLLLSFGNLSNTNARKAAKPCPKCNAPNLITAFICQKCNSPIKGMPLFIPSAGKTSKRRKAQFFGYKIAGVFIAITFVIFIALIYFYTSK